MLRILLTALAAGGILATAATAEPRLNDCDWPASVRNVVEPWEGATRTFANGKIRIVHVDTGGEPVCCSSHLVILTPSPPDEPAFGQCFTLSDGGTGLGFQWLDMKAVSAAYDPARGLLIRVPVERYVDGLKSAKDVIAVRINQATGTVTLE